MPVPAVPAPAAPIVPASAMPTSAMPAPVTEALGNGAPSNATVANKAWYTITIGRSVGIFCGWHNVPPLVNGVKGFCVVCHLSWEAALDTFEEAEASGIVK
ncbi:hypothetical protein C0995_000710, partial [Termitomyces sp. Mi166